MCLIFNLQISYVFSFYFIYHILSRTRGFGGR